MNKLLNNLLGMYKQAKMKKSAMIIDEILDRKNGASYNPQDFYDYVSQQLDVLNSKDIATALDSGTEEDVKKALCEYIKLGEYNPAICDYINSVNWLEEEDVEKWFSIKLSDEQAKEFTKLLTENNIKNKSKKEGEEIRVSFFLLPSSIGVAQGLLAATLSKFPDKQAKLNKKAEEDLIEVGWGLYTNDEYEIEENALYGGGEIKEVNKSFWDKINKDIEKVEMWFLKDGYKQFFAKVRDEGHGKDNELGGTAWMTKQQIQDFIDRAERTDGNRYTIREEIGGINVPFDYDETLFFTLDIIVDEETLDNLNIESKRVSKNKKLSSKNTKLTKKAGWKVLTPKDLTEEVKDEFLKDSIKEYAGHVKKEDFYFVKGIKEKEDDQFSYEWEEGMFGEWGTNVKGEKWYSLTDLGDDWDYIYLIKEDKLYKMPNRESLTDFGVVSSKRVKLRKKAMRKKAFRKLCLKRAFHKTAGEFEEMMKLKSTDPKLISYLAKEFGVEESTISQYTDVSENAEELYNILEQQANKYGYEWDKFEYDEYGDRIDEDDFRGDPDDLEKAVEYLKNNIDKSMFKFEYVGQYEDNYLTFSVNEKLIPIEKPIIHITNYTKNYDISFFVESQKAKEEDKAEGIYTEDNLSILIRRTSDEILNEIVNYINVELPKKIEEQNKKQSSKAELVRKQADEKSERVKKDIEKVVSEMGKSLKVVFRDFGDGYKIGKKEIEDFIKGTGTQVKVLDSGEYILVSPSGKEQTLFNDDTLYIKDNDVYIKQPGMFPKKLASSTKKQATIKHENGVYNVYSESGKCLGKGYKTKEEAEKRLKQVEYFKNKNSSLSRKAYLQISKEMIEDALNVLQSQLSLYNKKYNTDEEIGKAEIEQKNKEYNFTKKWNYEYGNFINRHNDVFNKLYKNQISIEQAVEKINALEKQISNKRTSLKDIVISKMAKSLKDIPDSVKKNILSDLVYVILTGKGSFAYKTVAKKLETIIKDLGYGDKLKANEDGSLPTNEIVELISKEPKAMELAGKFANITRAF